MSLCAILVKLAPQLGLTLATGSYTCVVVLNMLQSFIFLPIVDATEVCAEVQTIVNLFSRGIDGITSQMLNDSIYIYHLDVLSSPYSIHPIQVLQAVRSFRARYETKLWKELRYTPSGQGPLS